MASSSRRVYIDWLRGIAVVFMIEWHAIDAWTSIDARDGGFYTFLTFCGGWAAPMFLFLAGVSLPMAGESHMRKGLTRRDASWAVQKRGWQIFGLAHVFRLQSFLINPMATGFEIIKPDILNILGLGMVIAAWCWGRAVTARQRLIWFLGPATAVVVLAGASDGWWWPTLLHPRLQAYLRYTTDAAGVPLGVFFLLPWVAYVFVGAFIGSWIAAARSTDADRVFHLRLGAIGIGIAVAGTVGSYLPAPFASSFFWTTSISLFLMRTGTMTFALAVAWLWMKRPTADRWSPMVVFGRTSLFVYWVHIEIAYGFITHPIQRHLTLGSAATAVAALEVVMLALAVLWSRRTVAPSLIPPHMVAGRVGSARQI